MNYILGEKRKGKRGKGNRNKIMVVEIRKRRGKVSIRIVHDVSVKSFMTENAKKSTKGTLVGEIASFWKNNIQISIAGNPAQGISCYLSAILLSHTSLQK